MFKNLLNKLIFNWKFKNIDKYLKSKNFPFKIEFDKHWKYNVNRDETFFTIVNNEDKLKGSIQISIFHKFTENELITNYSDFKEFVIKKHSNIPIEITLKNLNCIYYRQKIKGSNLDFYIWEFYVENKYLKINFMIYENEIEEIKQQWLTRVKNIINSIEFENK